MRPEDDAFHSLEVPAVLPQGSGEGAAVDTFAGEPLLVVAVTVGAVLFSPVVLEAQRDCPLVFVPPGHALRKLFANPQQVMRLPAVAPANDAREFLDVGDVSPVVAGPVLPALVRNLSGDARGDAHFHKSLMAV